MTFGADGGKIGADNARYADMLSLADAAGIDCWSKIYKLSFAEYVNLAYLFFLAD